MLNEFFTPSVHQNKHQVVPAGLSGSDHTWLQPPPFTDEQHQREERGEGISSWPPGPCSWQANPSLAMLTAHFCTLSAQAACGMSSISNQALQSLLTRRTTIHSCKRFMTQLCTLYCLLSHKTSANPIKNLAEPLPHLFRPEASCRDNSLGTSSLKPALEQKQFASLLIFIHFHLAIAAPCASQIQSF